MVGAFIVGGCHSPFSPVEWTTDQEAKIALAIYQVAETEIRSVLSDLDGIRNVTVAPDLSAYESAITSRFDSYGLQTDSMPVSAEVLWTWDETDGSHTTQNSFTMNNLIAMKLGTDPSLAPVLITAHWDTVANTTGLNDNASGTAGVLEAARVLQGLSFKRTIIYVLFAFEEDWFLGSQAYVDTLDQAPHAVVNLEMIGFTSEIQNSLPITGNLIDFPVPSSDAIPRTGDFILIVGNNEAKNLGLDFCRIADAFTPDLKYYFLSTDQQVGNNPFLGDLQRSDHNPFWGLSAPAVMITDTADFREGTPYHTPEDTIDKIDFPFMINVIKASIATVCLQAEVL